MIKINLIGEGRRPAAVRKRRDLSVSFKKENLGNYLLLVGIVAGLLLWAGEWWLLKSDFKTKQEQVATLQKEYNRLKPIIEKVNKFKKRQADLESKIEVINNLKLSQKGPVRVMDAVSRAVPDRVWIRRMVLDGKLIKLTGLAGNENVVAAFIDNLDKIPEFQEPVLLAMREQRDAFSFEIHVGYSLASPSAPKTETAAGG
jgi:type IV pilus assembly protein PilN